MREIPQPVPAELGYHMPAEWHPHQSTWLAWPKDPITWPNRVLDVQEIFLHLIVSLVQGEKVDLLVDNEQAELEVRHKLEERKVLISQINFHHIETVDAWIRDYGPNFLLRRHEERIELAFNHWKFNAWGKRYQELQKDAQIPKKVAPVLRVPRFTPDLVLEGGAVDVNGEGICLTTEQCLLNSNRNPGYSREEIEQYLKNYLGVHQVVWLGDGIVGDDTDGHIDDVARFVNSNTIVCVLEEDPADENHKPLQDNYNRLKKAFQLAHHAFEIIPLPMPGRMEGKTGRLPASYANFYIANGMALVPLFNHPNDYRALRTLQALFPGRQVRGLHCEPLLWGKGTLHCVTQQQPVRA